MGRLVKARSVDQVITYAPLPSQKAFHDLKCRFKGFSGPIGSGKSAALCHEAIRLGYLNGGRTGLLGSPTYPMLRDSTQKAFLEILESSEVPYELNRGENILRLTEVGSTILFRSMEEYERLRGTNLAWFGVDELTYTHEEAWLRLEGRLRDPKATRLCGYAVWTPKGFDWVYRRFVRTRNSEYQIVYAKPSENTHILDTIPDFYERLKRTYDDDFFKQEVLGEYVESGTDQAYRRFSEEEHVTEREIRDDLPLLWSLDFNVDPMCSVVAQRIGDHVHVVDEIVLRRATTLEACQEFWQRHGTHFAGFHVYGDASGSNSHTTGTSDYQVIRDFFCKCGHGRVEQRVLRSNPSVKQRIELVNARLKNAARENNLTVSAKCKRLIEDLREVAFQQGTFVLEKTKRPELTHLSDALGYLVWYEFGGGGRDSGERGRRLL